MEETWFTKSEAANILRMDTFILEELLIEAGMMENFKGSFLIKNENIKSTFVDGGDWHADFYRIDFTLDGIDFVKSKLLEIRPNLFERLNNRSVNTKYLSKEDFKKIAKHACTFIAINRHFPRVKTVKKDLWCNFFTLEDHLDYYYDTIISDYTIEKWRKYCSK